MAELSIDNRDTARARYANAARAAADGNHDQAAAFETSGGCCPRRRLTRREAARVLRPGGRFAVSDVTADPETDPATRADMAAWTGVASPARSPPTVRDRADDAGFRRSISARPTASNERAASAIISRANQQAAH